jgi:hypothetical protein
VSEPGQQQSKLVEDVRALAGSGQKDQVAPASAPIENFEINAGLHSDELRAVWRGVLNLLSAYSLTIAGAG